MSSNIIYLLTSDMLLLVRALYRFPLVYSVLYANLLYTLHNYTSYTLNILSWSRNIKKNMFLAQ